MRLSRWLLLALALTLFGCPEPTGSTTSDDDDFGLGGGEDLEEDDGPPLPSLPRLGSLEPRDYLFDGAAFDREGMIVAELVRVEADSFVVRVDGGPQREVPRTAAWPSACLTRPLTIREGALEVTLEAGAPVLVLSSGADAARVSVALDSEHSEVVRGTRLAYDACDPPAPASAPSRVAAVPAGDVPCVFADQETLESAAGLVVPAGAPVEALETDGPWSRVRVEVHGGSVTGWMSSSLVSDSGAASPWPRDALSGGRCVHVGRVDPRESTGVLQPTDGPEGTLSPEQIARVMRDAEPQVRGCYDTRREALADARVTLELTMVVDADGRVYEARVVRGGETDAQLTACVIARARRWRFPAPRTGVLQVRHVFELGGPRPAPAD